MLCLLTIVLGGCVGTINTGPINTNQESLNDACLVNPFAPIADCETSTYDSHRTKLCLEGSSGDSRCDNLVSIYCRDVSNPSNAFGKNCKNIHGDEAQRSHCVAGIIEHGDCPTRIDTHCLFKPFDDVCVGRDSIFTYRYQYCDNYPEHHTDPVCEGYIVKACTNNPFESNCGHDDYNAARNLKISQSADDGVVSYADWVQVASPDEEPTTNNRSNHFIQSKGDNIYGNYSFVRLNSKNGLPSLATPLNLGGDLENGIRTSRGTDGSHYAGIAPNTNLGKPLIENSGSAKWRGFVGSAFFNKEFTLDVDFLNNNVEGFFSGHEKSEFYDNGTHYLLSGIYDARGVIQGTAIRADFAGDIKTGTQTNIHSGTMTGLIGQEGAVGVFISDNFSNDSDSFSGGFVAVSPN